MSTHKQREIYPERMNFNGAEGRLEIERIRFPGEHVSTEIRACINNGAQYAVYIRGDSPLGEYLADFSAPELLVDLEDAAREMLRATVDPYPSDLIRLICQHAVNKWEAAKK